MTDFVERYLAAVRRLLPHGQQDDITAELSDSIQSSIEDKERQLGRKLTAAEVKAILNALGSPMTVAARYGSNRYLIGPAVFPAWWLALRAILAVVVFAGVLGAVVRTALALARGEPVDIGETLLHTFGDLVFSAFFMVGVMTVIAVFIERARPDLLDKDWRPERLPKAPRRPKPRSRLDGAFGLAANVILFVWLLGFIEAPDAYPPYLSPEHWIETTGLALAPVWREQLFPLILIRFIPLAALHGVMLAWPQSQRRFAAAKIVSDATAVALAAAVLQAGPLFAAAPGLAGDAKVDQVLQAVTFALRLAFLIAGVVSAISIPVQLWFLCGPRRRQPA